MTEQKSEQVEVEEHREIWGWQNDEGEWTKMATNGHEITRAEFTAEIAPFGLELAGNFQRIFNLMPGGDMTPITMVKVRAIEEVSP